MLRKHKGEILASIWVWILALPLVPSAALLSRHTIDSVYVLGKYKNPIILESNHDPSVITAGSKSRPEYWLVSAEDIPDYAEAPYFPIYSSRDLVNWDKQGYVIGRRPKWARGLFWAPHIALQNNSYLVYFSALTSSPPAEALPDDIQRTYVAAARNKKVATDTKCIGVATAGMGKSGRPNLSKDGTGQVFPQTTRILTCDLEGGSIDPTLAKDENTGQLYLLWKVDRNGPHGFENKVPEVRAQEISAGGDALVGGFHRILMREYTWEGDSIGGPSVLFWNNRYYLFYSTGTQPSGPDCDYQLGVARSSTLLGPYKKYPKPVLSKGDAWGCVGQGNAVSVASGNNRHWYFVHHAMRRGGGLNIVMTPFKWNAEDWPHFQGRATVVEGPSPYRTYQKTRILDVRGLPALEYWPLMACALVLVLPGAVLLRSLSGRARAIASAANVRS